LTGSVFEEIRAACARVADRATHVRIESAGLDALVRRLAMEPPPPPSLDPAHHALSDPDDTLAYVITLDAINFGSGWFPVLRKREGLSGYFTIAHGLKERFEREGPWGAEALALLSADDCAAVFSQDPSGEAFPLMQHFARALRDLGALLRARFDGSFRALVERAGGSAAALVGILAEMPYYRDVALHDGEPVPLYKRAQLTASDLHAAFRGEGPGRFDDLERLTIFADNLVPHVLRRDGVLRYTAELSGRIDAGERLDAGSPEEVEIRACAVHAVERCVAALASRGVATSAQRLDSWLWSRGQLPEMKSHPRHRARSVYY
jgi:hypothetical protein